MDTSDQLRTAATLLADDTFKRNCPMRSAMDQATTRWATLVLAALVQQPHRFNALQARVGGISAKMLAQNLKALERSGLVHREVEPSAPPRVTYSLTDLGADLAGPLCTLIHWFGQHAQQVQGAQALFDARPGPQAGPEPAHAPSGAPLTATPHPRHVQPQAQSYRR